jgi:hypothetical protein
MINTLAHAALALAYGLFRLRRRVRRGCPRLELNQ